MPGELLTYSRVQEHLHALVPPRSPLLEALEREAEETGFPIIGPAAGQVCYLLARLLNARRVLEMGSGFGYSTAWFARAVEENGGGEVHHIVWDQGLSDRARGHLNALGYGPLIRYHVAEAVETLGRIDGPFDLIFNDIDKQAYPGSLDLIWNKLRPGGLLIVDNLLWDGQVFDDGDLSPDTAAIRELTRLVSSDPRWISSILPIRDGLLVAYKR